MSYTFKKLSAYVDVLCEWVSTPTPRNDKIDQLKAENAQLRELVKDMCEWAYIDSCCDLQGEFAERMQALGIEVDRC